MMKNDNMIEVDVFDVDGVEYIQIGNVSYNDIEYIILGREDVEGDILIKRVVGDEYLPIESEEEF